MTHNTAEGFELATAGKPGQALTSDMLCGENFHSFYVLVRFRYSLFAIGYDKYVVIFLLVFLSLSILDI